MSPCHLIMPLIHEVHFDKIGTEDKVELMVDL